VPDAGLRQRARRGAARGRSLLLITHHLAGLEHLVDEVAVLEAGRVAQRMPVAACGGTLAEGDPAR